MTSRLAWKPYMYNPTLPRLLGAVQAPALVITGDTDAVVPPECAALYAEALPNATLETMPGCGHAVDVEHPEALAAAVTSFLKRSGQ
jgi:pimeloyl-ACP methyl ester carboxylesterase